MKPIARQLLQLSFPVRVPYVPNEKSGTVYAIDAAARQVIKEISVGELPWGAVIQ